MIYNESKYNRQWETKKLSELGVFARGKSKHRPRNDERLFERRWISSCADWRNKGCKLIYKAS